jgi:CRISPR-associated protein Cmr5
MEKIFKTTDQKRAKIVFEDIMEIKAKDKDGETELAKKYGSLALAAPTLIRTAGFVQALAFYEAKGGAKGNKHHLELIKNWTRELRDLKVIPEDKESLREYATSDSCGLVEYMRLTREVLALSQWHRRFAQSVLKAEIGG